RRAPLPHPHQGPGLLQVRRVRVARGGARVRSAGLRAGARAAADPHRGEAPEHLADGRVRDDGDRRAPARRRPGLDPAVRDSARHALRALDRARDLPRAALAGVSYPKIELHVHLEGTVRPKTLLEIARRNDYALPADTEEGLAELYDFRDFAHFLEVWILTTNALRTEADFRQVVVDYAAEAASHGAVYMEGIFSPAERVARGIGWDGIF